MAYLPEWYYYVAGLADKLQGSVIPSDKPNYLVYTRHEPVGVRGGGASSARGWKNAARAPA